jgi:hypothetical protein
VIEVVKGISLRFYSDCFFLGGLGWEALGSPANSRETGWLDIKKNFQFYFVIISGQLAELAEPLKKLAPLAVTDLLRVQDIPPIPEGYP